MAKNEFDVMPFSFCVWSLGSGYTVQAALKGQSGACCWCLVYPCVAVRERRLHRAPPYTVASRLMEL